MDAIGLVTCASLYGLIHQRQDICADYAANVLLSVSSDKLTLNNALSLLPAAISGFCILTDEILADCFNKHGQLSAAYCRVDALIN